MSLTPEAEDRPSGLEPIEPLRLYLEPMEPLPDSLLLFDGQQRPRLDLSSAVEIARDVNRPEPQKVALCRRTFEGLLAGRQEEKIGPGTLQIIVNKMVEVDDSEGKKRTRQALAGMSERDLKQFTDRQSVNLMIRLGMPDLQVCSPKRLAAYLGHYSFRLQRARRILRSTVLAPIEEEKQSYYMIDMRDHCENLFCAAEEREEEFIQQLALALVGKQSRKIPYHLQRTVRQCAENYPCAQEVLNVWEEKSYLPLRRSLGIEEDEGVDDLDTTSEEEQ